MASSPVDQSHPQAPTIPPGGRTARTGWRQRERRRSCQNRARERAGSQFARLTCLAGHGGRPVVCSAGSAARDRTGTFCHWMYPDRSPAMPRPNLNERSVTGHRQFGIRHRPSWRPPRPCAVRDLSVILSRTRRLIRFPPKEPNRFCKLPFLATSEPNPSTSAPVRRSNERGENSRQILPPHTTIQSQCPPPIPSVRPSFLSVTAHRAEARSIPARLAASDVPPRAKPFDWPEERS